MPKISVIMPSLNVATYYAECIESVLDQSFTDIEVIAVDAGSTDGTLDILNRYAQSDNRIKVIHSPKKSYGAQMNMGIDAASGEYVAFLETDDYFYRYALEKLLDIAEDDDLDYIKGWTYGFWEYGTDKKIVEDDKIFMNLPNGEDILSPNEFPKLLLYDYHVWNGLYKRKFLENIRFNETKGAAFQDIGFIVQCLIRASRVRYVDFPVYWYRRNNADSSVYNPLGLKYLADEYEIIAQMGGEISKIQWTFIWRRLIIQTMTRLYTMYKSGKIWSSMESDLRRICILIKQADMKGQILDEFDNIVYKKLLRLMLAEKYELLKYTSWLVAPIKPIIDVFSSDTFLIYGAGIRGHAAFSAAIKTHSKPPTAFVDSNSKMWGKIVSGTKVISTSEATEKYPDAKYIIAAKGQEHNIKETLKIAGTSLARIPSKCC